MIVSGCSGTSFLAWFLTVVGVGAGGRHRAEANHGSFIGSTKLMSFILSHTPCVNNDPWGSCFHRPKVAPFPKNQPAPFGRVLNRETSQFHPVEEGTSTRAQPIYNTANPLTIICPAHVFPGVLPALVNLDSPVLFRLPLQVLEGEPVGSVSFAIGIGLGLAKLIFSRVWVI